MKLRVGAKQTQPQSKIEEQTKCQEVRKYDRTQMLTSRPHKTKTNNMPAPENKIRLVNYLMLRIELRKKRPTTHASEE